ncbi:hypothetical protein M427DRAFT_27302 [Gonapodya prolifera JEL478]|uniref:Thioesterase/thiol ester dehydrase-isomerase n=1 Tax=Gonapodya prolifera (strain JEL478) TaxID=1344416 RepID=A0A139AYS8_GONPJ|nr:hypothetical protein M427DRAFT_27302 [Gonapodya prolifera JEL478]|eukprot:KXS21713.1 hypothetical protein M427DRAFT_27302 [Gonapodya prolifera JEL478]
MASQGTGKGSAPKQPPFMFDEDTVVTPIEGRSGFYRCTLNPRWQNNNGTVFGGYVIPLVLRAIQLELAPYGFDTPVSCYLQYLIAPKVDDTIEIHVVVNKRGKNYAFTTTTIHSLAKKAPSHVVTSVYGTKAARHQTIFKERRIDHLRKPQLCAGGTRRIEVCQNMWKLMGRTDVHHFNRGIELLMDPSDFKDLQSRASGLLSKSTRKATMPPPEVPNNQIYSSELDEMMELRLDLAVRFLDGRPHDDLSVAMITDAIWGMNEYFAMDEGLPDGKRFTSSTMSLALHFFASPQPGSAFLCARGDITVVNGQFSEFEALIFDQKTGALLCTGRQVQVVNAESADEIRTQRERRIAGAKI